MAPRPAARRAASNPDEQSEREYQATLNRAVEDTEGEIFADAMGDKEFENDGDTSLEEMGDGLEGEVLEDEAEPEGDEIDEGDEEQDEEDYDEDDADENEGEGEGEDDGSEFERNSGQQGRQQQVDGRVPPGRFREEANARRAAENEADGLRRQMAEMNGRMAELSARVNAPQQRQQPTAPTPKPDMFAEPEKYEAWVLEQADARAEARMNERFQSFQQNQQQVQSQRTDTALGEAARGPRSFEFGAAYNALTSLDPSNPRNRAIVSRIYNAGDNAEQALWDWWEQNGGPEYREQVAEQLSPRQRRQQERDFARDDRGGERVFRDDRGREVRHVVRPGQRLPSLNSASGSMRTRGQVQDPEMNDGSDEAIFRYAMRR